MSDDVRQLADDYHDHWMRTSPSWAHMVGDYRFADRYEDVSRAAEDELIAADRAFAARAAAIPDEGLSLQDRATRDVVAFQATSGADWAECRTEELAVNPIFGPQVDLPLTVANLAMPTAEVAEAMVQKYHSIGQYLRDSAERHRQGVASGRTPASFAVTQTVPQLDAWLAKPLSEDPLLQTSDLPADVDADAWRARLTEAIGEAVRPGLQVYRDVLADEVAPHTRPDDRCGLSWLPDGEQTYARALAANTTTTLSAQEIHDLGLQQIASLEEEYATLGGEVLGTSDVPAIYDRLRTDPALRHHDAAEILAECETAFARARAEMPAWFNRLPAADCAIKTTTQGALGFYYPPSEDGSRGGVFYVNTSDPAAWGRVEIEALSYHEGIPGHHLQLAIASELTDMPALRRHTVFNAYAEGWGLYTERLADEMGLYSSPLTRLGMLTMDSVRACRLVVDTGLHALGWSRQQAIDYMVANSPMSTANVTSEVNRYAVYPGQACGYMVGRLEILRIRREAQERQGDGFDIKAFHDAVLDGGSVPLGVLDTIVRDRLP
ncbi:Uncharacterized conserved protein, DUF885 familyt [Pedococcus dokdonensis]|uniref:Uncharacterized conserved protein, DUF885 familyt n=1 Tax=Pedococcus dokdonensis TaxID=443156 RepID=A0A1H0TCF8_9MICO|nr:DUF885 domain-containing protein [Pedococcus dokdonensis]SDP51196.1 Uncharacterized conserved protein, DUF885 familyt [Pedococcus dokdonensis]